MNIGRVFPDISWREQVKFW